tara:strand:+ start:4271 stop:5710 length:1440 start_codon:yes stop_codon:yes gene_type:complete
MKSLDALEKIAKQLDPNREERRHIRTLIIQHTEKFLEKLPNGKAYSNPDKSNTLWDEDFLEEGSDPSQVVRLTSHQIDHDGINAASGFDMAYVPGGGVYTSALADYWSDITNLYSGVFFANPGAVRLENQVISWLSSLVSYPKTACGNLTSGGSIANLTAIITAREVTQLKAKDHVNCIIYLGKQTHHCVTKALKMAGLGEVILRYIELDSGYRMIPAQLEKQIKQDQLNGCIPWMIVASAGTTDTGAVDPLEAIGSIALKNKIWYHVDAAYGGFFLLTSTGKKLLKGIEAADSIVLDPHKSLFLPYGSGVILIKNGADMKKTFSDTAAYFQDFEINDMNVSPADLSIELTRPFRGLRMWLPLKIHGIAPFRAALNEKLILSKYFYEQILACGFQSSGPPQLTITTFWYPMDGGKNNDFNKELIQNIQQEGQIFLSSTMIENRFVIRLCVLVFRTHKREIDIAIKNIVQHKDQLLETWQ